MIIGKSNHTLDLVRTAFGERRITCDAPGIARVSCRVTDVALDGLLDGTSLDLSTGGKHGRRVRFNRSIPGEIKITVGGEGVVDVSCTITLAQLVELRELADAMPT